MRPFHIHRPKTVSEAVELRQELGDDAAYYAGGTELLLVMKQGFLDYEHLIDIKTIPGLTAIAVDDDTGELRIGALCTHAQIESSPIIREQFPTIARMASRVANARVRASGTIGGNLVFAEPHSDPAVLLLVYDAEVELTGLGGTERVERLGNFVLGPYESALEEGELLTTVRLHPLPPSSAVEYVKFGHLERPTIGVGVSLTETETGGELAARIAVGSVGPLPQRCEAAEARLAGVSLADVAEAAAAAADQAGEEVDVMEDIHGSEDYKRHLVVTLVRRALQSAALALREGRS